MRKIIYATILMGVTILAYEAWSWKSLPPLARGLPANFADAEIIFKERLRFKFQLGIAESDLVRELRAQGFDLPIQETDLVVTGPLGEGLHIRAQYKDRKYTTFSKVSFPCELVWWVL